jgi:DNA-binding MarR family transcriptional regulator
MTDTQTADPRLDQDAAALYDALSDLIRVYQFRDRDRICCHDLSITQCYALEALTKRSGATLNDMAADLFLDKSTASRVVSALDRKGYVERRPHPEDRRAIQLVVTPAGRELHDRIRRDIIEQEKRLLRDFDPETRASLATLLRRLAQGAAAGVEVSGGMCCTKPALE